MRGGQKYCFLGGLPTSYGYINVNKSIIVFDASPHF